MNKNEFENLINGKVSEEEYKAIERVYTFHPAIDDIKGKEQIASLWNIGGMAIIEDMKETAEIAMQIENLINTKKNEISDLQKALESLKKHGSGSLNEIKITLSSMIKEIEMV